MQRLLLTSQGLQHNIKKTFISLLSKPPKEILVSFITTAAYGQEKHPQWLEVYRQQLRECGIEDIEDLDIKGKTQHELQGMLERKDVIFVNGGSTFYLLYWARKSGFDKIVQSLLNNGKIYVGISAGSYIACPTIEQSTWKHPNKDRYGLTDLTALNLIPFLITAHYQTGYRSIIEQAAQKSSFPIVALNDNQALLVENGYYKLVGDTEKVFFNGFKENGV